MRGLNWFRRGSLSAKASQTARLVSIEPLGRPVWTSRDFAALAREGYLRNAIAHRCVRLIAENAAAIPLDLRIGDREALDHPVLALLGAPNPRQTGAELFDRIYGYLLVSGNAYVEAVSLDAELRELFVLRPDRIRVVPGSDGWPSAFEYAVNGRSFRIEQGDAALPPILHLKLFHPLDDHYGLSPLEAAQTALDTHNAASAWHKALLDNAARPSGALVYAGPDGGTLPQDQFERLKSELEENFQGAANAGRPLLLEGGLDWKPMGLAPKELDFAEAKAASAREIALAFGVPPMLLGLPGDNTFANYQEANRALLRHTVLPLVGRVTTALAAWLSKAYGETLRLEPDLDRIEVLSSERDALWQRVGAAGFLSDDEKRVAVGYAPRG